MKKLIAVLNVFTVMLMAGAYVLHFFSVRKLGMVRWLNFHSQNIENAIPLDVVKFIVLAVAVVFITVLAWRILKSPHRSGGAIANVVLAILVAVAYALVVFAISREVTTAYVFITIIVVVAALLQTLTLALVNVRLGQ